MNTERLVPSELQRYGRQMMLREFGKRRQLKLKRAEVVVVGLGGLGSPASIYLAAAGVGRLKIIDAGEVELSNLNRQVLHWEKDLNRSKAGSAAEKLRALNSGVQIESKEERITLENVEKMVKDSDVVVDAVDNYHTRFLLNSACVRLGIPLVHGAVEGFFGQIMTIVPGKGPCLRCLIHRVPPKKQVFPILGATPGVLGCLQAMEAIKLITGIGRPLVGRLLIFNGREMKFEEMMVKRNPRCPVCGRRAGFQKQ